VVGPDKGLYPQTFQEAISLTEDGRREYLILRDLYKKYVMPYKAWKQGRIY
jgi:hypothetical protein